jgi:1-acyl-sn-glycerol-3-phosphate acyltransferase
MLWYGWFMRLAGYLDVESSQWDGILRSAADLVAKGGHLLFFPEGHRSRTGELQHFHSGAFRLAADLDARLIPLCITGTDALLPPGRFWLQPAAVTLRVLCPVEGKAYSGSEGARALRKLVKGRMGESLARMRGSGT